MFSISNLLYFTKLTMGVNMGVTWFLDVIWYKNYSNHFLEHVFFSKKSTRGNPLKSTICSIFIMKLAVSRAFKRQNPWLTDIYIPDWYIYIPDCTLPPYRKWVDFHKITLRMHKYYHLKWQNNSNLHFNFGRWFHLILAMHPCGK